MSRVCLNITLKMTHGTCYNPMRCRHLSNCSTVTKITQCDYDEHQLTLLDQTVYSTVLDTYCHVFTCCEITHCLPPTLTPTAVPTMFVTNLMMTTQPNMDNNDTHSTAQEPWKLILGCVSGALTLLFFLYCVYNGILLYRESNKTNEVQPSSSPPSSPPPSTAGRIRRSSYS